jgi:two-component system, LytTR family, response regulator
MLSNLHYLIVDDEPLAIDVIENYLLRLDARRITRCENAVDAFQALQDKSFDLIFLDIEMPLLSGLEFLKGLKEPPAVIITTAYRDYAVESFELEVIDYLVKPIPFPRFMKAIEKMLKTIRQSVKKGEQAPIAESEYLFLKVDRKFVKVLINDILYIESLKDYIRVKTKKDSWVSYQSLTEITGKLPSERFIRVHRSFTIAIDKVNMIEGNCVEIDGKLIPISREHRQQVFAKITK